jgi:hypothetical protein
MSVNNMAKRKWAADTQRTHNERDLKLPRVSSFQDTVDERPGNPEQGLADVEPQLSTHLHPATSSVQEAIARVKARERELQDRFDKWQKKGTSSPPRLWDL